jgi:hypothetical protein
MYCVSSLLLRGSFISRSFLFIYHRSKLQGPSDGREKIILRSIIWDREGEKAKTLCQFKNPHNDQAVIGQKI